MTFLSNVVRKNSELKAETSRRHQAHLCRVLCSAYMILEVEQPYLFTGEKVWVLLA